MNTNRFISLLIAVSLLAVTVLVVREANATANVDSATLSYTSWAEAAEAEGSTMDSATRSYVAQAKAACSVVATYGPNLDSATRSYMAWGLASETGASCS